MQQDFDEFMSDFHDWDNAQFMWIYETNTVYVLDVIREKLTIYKIERKEE
jgi:hypothetical protein